MKSQNLYRMLNKIQKFIVHAVWNQKIYTACWLKSENLYRTLNEFRKFIPHAEWIQKIYTACWMKSENSYCTLNEIRKFILHAGWNQKIYTACWMKSENLPCMLGSSTIANNDQTLGPQSELGKFCQDTAHRSVVHEIFIILSSEHRVQQIPEGIFIRANYDRAWTKAT